MFVEDSIERFPGDGRFSFSDQSDDSWPVFSQDGLAEMSKDFSKEAPENFSHFL